MKKRLQRLEFSLKRKLKTTLLGGLLVLSTSLSFGQATLPYTEDFTASTGWSFTNGAQPNKWFIGDAGEGLGNFLYISGDRPLHPDNITPAGGSGATNDYRFYGTVPFATSTVHAYKSVALPTGIVNLQFDWRCFGEGSWDFLKVWIVPSTFTPTEGMSITAAADRVQIGGFFSNTTAWGTSANYVIPAVFGGTTARLVFEWTNDSSGGTQRPAAIDNISITSSTCAAPTALSVTGASSTTATLAWTENGTATSWGIEYGITGFTPTGTPTQTVSTNPATITSLTANTNYQYYVRAQCGGSNSVWTGPFSFTTGYCAVVTTDPDDYFSFATSGAANNVTYAPTTLPTDSYSDETAQAFTSFPGQTIDLSYDYFSPYSLTNPYSLKVWVDWNNDLDFNDLGEEVHANWTELPGTGNFTVPGTVTAGNYRVRVRASFNYNNNNVLNPCGNIQYGSTADFNLVITAAPTCVPPYALTASGLTSNSAVLAWLENGTATDWDLEYGVTGFTATGTPTTSVNANPATISSLLPNTTYDYYVRSVCSSSDKSTWAGPFTFTTKQVLASLPYTDDFSTNNWTFVNGNQPNKWFVGAATGNPANSMYISHTAGATNTYTIGVSSVTHAYREIDFPAGNVTFSLKFDWKAYGEGFSIYNYDYLNVWVVPMNSVFTPGVEIDATNTPGAIQLGGALLNTSTWVIGQELIIPTSFAGTSNRLVFEWINDAGSGDQDPAAIDNINITVVTCPAPTALAATNITTTAAELSWTENGISNDWEIQYGVASFFPNNGPFTVAGTNPFVLTNLQPATMYDYYVRTRCSTTDSSSWSGPYRFTTLCDVITVLPWTENFDNMPFVGNGLFPSCWVDENPGDWFTSDPVSSLLGQTPLSGTNFLNIGNYTDSKIWTPEFGLIGGETYEFSFNWAGDLGAGWDGSVYVNGSQTSVGATMLGAQFIVNGDSTILAYQKETFCFTPTTSGTYTFGIYVIESDFENYLSFDDFELKLAPTSTGTDGALAVCKTGSPVDLSGVITSSTTDGTWNNATYQTSITGNLLSLTNIPVGVHEILFITNSCLADTTIATITIDAPSSAGVDGTLSVCRNEPMNLFTGLTGTVNQGGVWTDPTAVVLPNGSAIASNIPGQYNYRYIVANGSCPSDTAKVVVLVGSCVYVGVEDIAFKAFNLYPNPTTDLVFISNSGSTEVFNYEVLDMNGRVILRADKAINGSTTTELNLGDVKMGIYMIRVFNEKAEKTFRVVKN